MVKFLENSLTSFQVKVNFNLLATILAGDPLEVGCYGDDQDSSTIEITENVSVFIPKEGTALSMGLIILGVTFFPAVVGATSFIKDSDLFKNKILEGKQEVEVKNDINTFNPERFRSYISSYFSKKAWATWIADPWKVQTETKILLGTASSLAMSYFALKLSKNTFPLAEINKRMVIPELEKVRITNEILTVNKTLPSGLEKSFYNKKMLTAKELSALFEKKHFVPKKLTKPTTSLELIIYEPPKKWGNQ